MILLYAQHDGRMELCTVGDRSVTAKKDQIVQTPEYLSRNISKNSFLDDFSLFFIFFQ